MLLQAGRMGTALRDEVGSCAARYQTKKSHSFAQECFFLGLVRVFLYKTCTVAESEALIFLVLNTTAVTLSRYQAIAVLEFVYRPHASIILIPPVSPSSAWATDERLLFNNFAVLLMMICSVGTYTLHASHGAKL